MYEHGLTSNQIQATNVLLRLSVPHLVQTSPLQNWVESMARKVYESWEHENNQIQPFMPVFVKPSKLHSWETHIHGRIIELANRFLLSQVN